MTPRKRSPRGAGRPYKRADGTWVGSVEMPRTDGKRRQKRVYARNYNDCLRKLAALRKALGELG